MESTLHSTAGTRPQPDADRLLEHLTASSPVVTVVGHADATLDLVWVSPNIEWVFGIHPDTVLGPITDWISHLHPDDGAALLNSVAHAIEGRSLQVEVELRFVGRDRRERVASGVLCFDYSQAPTGVIGYLTDVTRAAEIETQLLERERLLESVIDSSPDAILLLDETGQIRSASAGFSRMLGYRHSERWSPETVLAHLEAEDVELLTKELRRLYDGDCDQLVVRHTARHRTGTRLWLESQGRLLRSPNGKLFGAVVNSRDVTADIELQASLRSAIEETQRANEAKSAFLSRMSHELRTPLNAMLGFAQLLEMSSLEEEDRDSVARILKAGRHLLQLINEVLDIARIESGGLSLSLEPVQVESVLGEAVAYISPIAAEAGITLHQEIPETLVGAYVRADQQRLLQVVLNLLSNAVKYNSPRGRVEIRGRRDDRGRIHIGVRDEGNGISEDLLPKLFAPFERLGAEQTGIDGTGIGLALSRMLADAMGGELTVETATGRGSTFWIALDPVTDHEPCQVARRDGKSERRRVVLCIEDNIANVELFRRVFAQRPEVNLMTAMVGELGIELARQHQPDVVLLDLHLPDVDGETVLARLRGDPRTAGIPVLAVTADGTAHRRAALDAAGVVGYITKPVDIRSFLDTIDGLLHAPKEFTG